MDSLKCSLCSYPSKGAKCLVCENIVCHSCTSATKDGKPVCQKCYINTSYTQYEYVTVNSYVLNGNDHSISLNVKIRKVPICKNLYTPYQHLLDVVGAAIGIKGTRVVKLMFADNSKITVKSSDDNFKFVTSDLNKPLKCILEIDILG